MNLVEVRKFDELDPRKAKEEQLGEPVKDLVEVPLFEEESSKTCKIGSTFIKKRKEDLIYFMCQHKDVFTC